MVLGLRSVHHLMWQATDYSGDEASRKQGKTGRIGWRRLVFGYSRCKSASAQILPTAKSSGLFSYYYRPRFRTTKKEHPKDTTFLPHNHLPPGPDIVLMVLGLLRGLMVLGLLRGLMHHLMLVRLGHAELLILMVLVLYCSWRHNNFS